MNAMSSQPHQCMSQSGPAPRYSSLHSNSSAFSANAGPNEDWTKISDLAERRRIQNRIAQRNYRKKLKRRLEDLERRAASSSTSPEPNARDTHEFQPQTSKSTPRQRANTTEVGPLAQRQQSATPSFPHSRSISSYDDGSTFNYTSARQHSPVPAFSLPAFSREDSVYDPPYSSSPSYPSSTSRLDGSFYGNYLYQRPTTISTMGSNASLSIKQEHLEEDIRFPPMGYSLADVPRTGLCRDSNPNIYTPSLSDSLESLESCPSTIMGQPADLWALYPTPPAPMIEDEDSLFSMSFELCEKSDLFSGLGSNFESSYDEESILHL